MKTIIAGKEPLGIIFQKSLSVIGSGAKFIQIKTGIEKGKIWLETQDGEGGDFNQDELFSILEKFYNDRF